MSELPIACTLTDAERRRRQRELQEKLLRGVRETVELEDGYALRFPGGPEWVRELAELIVFERACCPFLTIELLAECDHGAAWLKLRGPDGTKEFLDLSFNLCRRAPSPRRTR